MDSIIRRIYEIGIVPVIALDDPDQAVPLAKALAAGGLPAAEVTFRTDAAEEAIRRIAEQVPGMLVGAGTVLTKDQVDRALAAGSQFLVSPGFNPEVTRYALSRGARMIPGTATPSEMEQAMSLGLKVVKFFPAEQNGGAAMLRAMAGPYRDLMWMPTGGINAKNLNDYLCFDRVLACGGTWMVKKDLIEAGRFDEVERLARQAVDTMLGFELGGLALRQAAEADQLDGLLRRGFDLETAPRYARGTKGQLTVKTNSVDRAAAHLLARGYALDESSRVERKGRAVSVWLAAEYGGFAVQLVQK